MYYVYILKWDTKHYIGYTNNLERRLEQHLQGKTQTTRKMWKVTLVGYFEKAEKTEAIGLEKMIKRDGHIVHRIEHPTFIKVCS